MLKYVSTIALIGGLVIAYSQVADSTTLRGSAKNNQSQDLIDPDLRIGVLPNGMRYYVRASKNPANRIFLQLAVNAGVLQEDDDQQGYAHFLEHMAFNGTKRFPHLELIDVVEGMGMNFGGDLNAYTSFDETVYKLTVPSDHPGFLKQGLDIIEDWASGGILNDSMEVVAERGVIFGEWRYRLQDSSTANIQESLLAAFLGDSSRYLRHPPIGDTSFILSANPAPLKRYYHDWYRPDLMAVIVVGDLDPDAIEKEIAERFGRIKSPSNPRPQISEHISYSSQKFVAFRGYSNTSSTGIMWQRPQESQNSLVALKEELIEGLMMSYVQKQFMTLSQKDKRPFLRASFSPAFIARGFGKGYYLSVEAYPDSLEQGVLAALTEIERVAQHGVPEELLDIEKASFLRYYQGLADQSKTDPSDALASQYVNHFLTGRGNLLNREQRYSLVQQAIQEIGSSDISQLASFWRDSNKRVVFFQIPALAPVLSPTESAFSSALDSIANTKLEPHHNLSASAASMTGSEGQILKEKPVPGTISDEKYHPESEIFEWNLSNGAKVLYKHTDFDPDQLILNAKSLGGFSRLPDSLFFSPGRLVAAIMTDVAGLGESRDKFALMRRLSNTGVREFRVGLSYTEEEVALEGSPRDLETLFQLLYLQFTAPNLDSVSLRQWKHNGAARLQRFDKLNDAIARTLSMGDPRLAPLSPALVQLVTVEEAMAVYRDRFGDASDFTFTIVGAAPPEQVREMVSKYVASLPSTNRSIRELPKDPQIPQFNQIARQRIPVQTTVPKSESVLIFDGVYPTDEESYIAENQKLATLSTALSRRLRLRLREELGATYGAMVNNFNYINPLQRYQFRISFDASPHRMEELIDVLMEALDSLRTHGITQEEIDKLDLVLDRQFENRALDNRYWVSKIQEFDRLNFNFERILNPFSRRLTPEEVKKAAQTYLPANSYFHAIAYPEQ